MKRFPPTRPSRNSFPTTLAVWSCCGLLLMSVLAAGCKKTTRDESKSDSKTPKTPTKTESDKTAKTAPVKKTAAPAKTQKTAVAKKETPKKKVAKLTEQDKAFIEAIIKLKEIGAEVKQNNLNEVVHVSFNVPEVVKEEHFALLKNFPNLRYLNATFVKVGDAAIKHLEGAEFMTSLYLRGTNIGNPSLEIIGKMDRLENLCVDKTKISDDGLQHLQGLPEIKKLHIRSRNKISDAGLKPLFKLKSLRQLKIGGTQVTSKGVKQLETLLPRCEINTDTFGG